MEAFSALWSGFSVLEKLIVGLVAGVVLSMGVALWWVVDDNADLTRKNGALNSQRLQAIQTANDNAEKIKLLAAANLSAAKSAATESVRAIEAEFRYATLLGEIEHGKHAPTGCAPGLGDPAPREMVDALRAAALGGLRVVP